MRIIIVFIFVCLQLAGISSIDPYYKEVLQRGFTMKGDSVIFPDGTSCLIETFNSGTCGSEWKKNSYCIPENGMVWDNDKCCEGLEPFLADETDGQATCQKIQNKYSIKRSSVIITALIFISGIIFLAVRTKARKTMRNKRR